MKKWLSMMMILTLCAGLTACGSKSDSQPGTSAAQAQTQEETTAPDTASETAAETSEVPSSAALSYAVTEARLEAENCHFVYPQFSNADPAISGFYNEQWAELARSYLQMTAKDPSRTCTVNYQIMTQSEDLLSILFTGEWTIEGGAYPSAFFLTYNIDMKTGETIRLADAVDLTALSAQLAEGDFSLPSDYSYLEDYKKDLFTGSSASDISARLEMADYEVTASEGGLTASNQTPADFSYYNNGELRIIVYTIHALGDFAALIPNT